MERKLYVVAWTFIQNLLYRAQHIKIIILEVLTPLPVVSVVLPAILAQNPYTGVDGNLFHIYFGKIMFMYLTVLYVPIRSDHPIVYGNLITIIDLFALRRIARTI